MNSLNEKFSEKRRGKFKIKERSSMQGSMTVEMSFLMPVILMIIMSSVLAAFYFHDKNILAGAAYETVVVGSTKVRERDGITEEELEKLLLERIKRKFILFSRVQTSVTVSEEEIQVEAKAKKGKFAVSVMKRAAVTEPEKHIRKIRRIREIADGAKDYN